VIVLDTHVWVRWVDSLVNPLSAALVEKIESADVLDLGFEFDEYLSIDHVCGYGSIIGDETRLQVDLCPHCVKELLLPFARLSIT
jgi:hypothetical protein